jgi:protein transport protein SEC23
VELLPNHDKDRLEHPWWKPPSPPSIPPLEHISSLDAQSIDNPIFNPAAQAYPVLCPLLSLRLYFFVLVSLSFTAPHPGQPMPQATFSAARSLMPVQQCEFQLTGILESLTRDPWPVANDRRPLRCTGVALSVAVGTYPNTGARVMFFTGGPATSTEGPGTVISNELKEPIRSHHEIERDTVKHYKRVNKVCTLHLCLYFLYEGLALQASNNGHAIDLFGGCLDQVGLLEMRSLPNSTNSVVVLSDSTATFRQSFLRVFNKDDQLEGHLSMGFNATFDVQVSLPLNRDHAYI